MLKTRPTDQNRAVTKGILLCLLWFLVSNAGLGCTGKTGEADDPIMATVQGEPIYKKELDLEILRVDKSFSLQSSQTEDKKLVAEVLHQMIQRKLLLTEFKKLKIALNKDQERKVLAEQKGEITQQDLEKMLERSGVTYEEWERKVIEDRKIELVIHKVIDPKIQISEQELYAYYQDHLDEYQTQERVKVRQIVLSNLHDAFNARNRIIDKKEDFGLVAQEVSLSPDAAQGGQIGTFPKGEMPPEFDQVCFSLQIGEISNVIQSPFGYHIFLVEERLPAGSMTFQEARKKIHKMLFTKQREDYFNQYQKELWDSAEISLHLDRR